MTTPLDITGHIQTQHEDLDYTWQENNPQAFQNLNQAHIGTQCTLTLAHSTQLTVHCSCAYFSLLTRKRKPQWIQSKRHTLTSDLARHRLRVKRVQATICISPQAELGRLHSAVTQYSHITSWKTSEASRNTRYTGKGSTSSTLIVSWHG